MAALSKRHLLLLGVILIAAITFWSLWPASGKLLEYAWWRLTVGRDVAARFVRVGDESLYVETIGEGPAVLLLPGGLGTIDSFFSQLPVLAAEFRVIAVEPRGHGRSYPVTELTYRRLAADAIAVLDALGIPQVAVIGWSDGGTTGLMMALEHPDRVSRLVSISANFAPSGIDPAEQQRILDAQPQEHGWLPRLIYRWRAGANADWPKLWQAVTTMWRTRPVVPMAELRLIPVSTLLIVGDDDLVTVDHAEEIAQELPNSKLVVLDEGHHTSLVWHANRVNQLIIEFLRADSR